MFRKNIALVVIFLFIGLTFAPSINANISKNSEIKISKPHTLTVIDEIKSEIQRDDIFKKSILISAPKIQKVGDYYKIHIEEETSQTMQPNEPLLPVVTHVFLFPLKTKIINVSVNFYGEKEKKISDPICLAPEPLPNICHININKMTSPFENGKKSLDSLLYPEKQYNYHVSAGRYNDKIVNYLSVNLYPVQYDPLNNTVNYWNEADISISYEIPQKPITFGDEYDLIIIAPLWFSKELKPLVDHKNIHGIRSKLITLNQIYWGVYFPVEGRDRAEKIKYFIKHALDEWGIKYVLMVGGRKGGLFEPRWWVPVRYSNLVDFIEHSFLSDFYFADIYDAEGNFSSWDSNKNGIFAEWRNTTSKDIIDMYPEVSVGRLPCKNLDEVQIMVNKIITYENSAYGKDWFKKFIGVAGDNIPEYNSPYYEGEISTETSYSYLDGFEAVYLWTSTGSFTDKHDVINEVNKGCGLMSFSGHSTPKEWSNHPPNNKSWIEGPTTFEMNEYQNYEKLPIVVVTGCWISKFDTSLLNMLKGIITEGLDYFASGVFPKGYHSDEWVPKCWSWSMCSQNDGGCIAIIGPTGLGYGIKGENCTSGLIHFLEIQFFKSYSEGKDMLGETHLSQLIYYMNEFPPMDHKWDCKHIQETVLFGDPSLKIGGYPPTTE
jgi:hypothetical protein